MSLSQFGLFFSLFFSHRFAFEDQFISVVNEAIENGISQGGIDDDLMPVF